MTPTSDSKQKVIGVWYGIAAFVLWGILPLYWKALQQVSAYEILSHRILWSFVFVFLLLVVKKRLNKIKEVMRHRKNRWIILASSLLISANWLIYIWAVNANYVVEVSLGYYINPLLSIFLGMVVLKERLNPFQLIAILLALIGVALMTIQFGKVPWIAISLALTFGLYGLTKKLVNLDSMITIALETLFVVPIAFIYLSFLEIQGGGAFIGTSSGVTLLLMGAGVVTAMPLLWFAQSARRVALSTVGFMQYLAPTIMLFLGIFVFKETFTKEHFITFAFIWGALVLYTLSTMNVSQHLPKAVRKRVT